MKINILTLTAAVSLAMAPPPEAHASSHMDAPLITRDPSANTTDVYAFVDQDDASAADLVGGGTQPPKSLVVALAVYPHEEPGVGPNIYNFDDDVLYEIHVATGRDVAAGRAYHQLSVPIQDHIQEPEHHSGFLPWRYQPTVGDDNQNLIQTYTVTKVTWHSKTVLGTGVVPPNNQGRRYALLQPRDNRRQPAKDGVSTLS